MFSNLNKTSYLNIPRWVITLLILFYLLLCALAGVFILPLPYSRYVETVCRVRGITEIAPNKQQQYGIKIRVSFQYLTLNAETSVVSPVWYNSTIEDICVRSTPEQVEQCVQSMHLDRAFKCYARESAQKQQRRPESILSFFSSFVLSSSMTRATTKEQQQEQYANNNYNDSENEANEQYALLLMINGHEIGNEEMWSAISTSADTANSNEQSSRRMFSTTATPESSEEWIVRTGAQLRAEYIQGSHTVFRILLIGIGSLLAVTVAGSMFYIVRYGKSAVSLIWSSVIGTLVRQPVRPDYDDYFLFDEGESHSSPSFISTESYYTSARKCKCQSLLSFTAKKELMSHVMSPSTTVLRERVHWHYHPRPYNVLKSNDAGTLLINVSIVVFLVVLIIVGFVLFGIAVLSFGLVVFITLILLIVLMIVLCLLIQAYAAVFGVHYFLTEYRVIVLMELPLRLGYVCYYKSYADLEQAIVHQLYTNVYVQSGYSASEHSAEDSIDHQSFGDNEGILVGTGDDYEGAVAFAVRNSGENPTKLTATFQYVPNVDGIVEFVRRKIELTRGSSTIQHVQPESQEEQVIFFGVENEEYIRNE